MLPSVLMAKQSFHLLGFRITRSCSRRVQNGHLSTTILPQSWRECTMQPSLEYRFRQMMVKFTQRLTSTCIPTPIIEEP
ncbi:hypothetical protein AVEN_13312-1 [Araneus ventricosus]|uniref:Uncharacterized protein n=1 Tax=Araneus ventricosus TaxID=182803 RepID=A0A4Y2IIG1_ARAVE|nr:hypothetical protein AVEN_13312-1 [Araneus ventricosus]